MKKGFALLLFLTMAFSLASCGSNPAQTGAPTPSLTTTDAPLVETPETTAPMESVTPTETPTEEEVSMNKITVSFGAHTYAATLEGNAAAEAFAELLQSKGGSMIICMSEYGGWEKVGPLGQTLPSSDAQTTTAAGDLVLYSGNQIVLFYGSNSWSYTRLGRLDDPSGLRDALGSGDRDIIFALAE